ncbi:hypothetical protein [Xenophilus sp. Marseille-Q4582]|uniref:hypothetical protein n=1 Tax=Xenophilus sp. Marseille-Q4582 TaxID=2866600 RepID=UPI001CE471C4|nr:hypothetical protein [Xenophilus sp. Marseille-Q4582]
METNTPKPSTRTAADWEAIQRDYRAGIKTLRQMADFHGVSHTAIRKRADREGWVKDLSGEIAAKAEALVSKAVLTPEVSSGKHFSDAEIVEANATAIVQVRVRHRQDVARLTATIARINKALDSEEGQRLPLNVQAKSAKALVDAQNSLIALERQAFGITTEAPKDDSLSDIATAELLKLRARIANG